MRKNNLPFVIAIIFMIVGVAAWIYQLMNGLAVTNMRNSFDWGLYIAAFAFLVGIAAGGLIISSSVYLFNIEKLKPFTRLASLSAFASILGAGVMVLIDMGRIDRLYNLLLHPNLRSPLVWDVIVVTAYMFLTFFSVYVQLLPDWRKEGRGFLNGWTKKLSVEQVEEFSKKWSKRISVVGLPVALLIHTVTALIFATQASRGWWNTATLPPDFILMAVSSGTALVMVIALLVVGREKFHQYQEAFQIMARIISIALVAHFFLVSMDLLIHWWWGKGEALHILSLVFGQYGLIYATEIILPAFTMFYFFTKKGTSSFNSLTLGSILLFIGVFTHRMMLMLPSFNAIPLSGGIPGMDIESWAYPIALGQFEEGMPIFVNTWPYLPNLVEYGVAMLPFGLLLFVLAFFIRYYDFLPQKSYKNLQTPKVDNLSV